MCCTSYVPFILELLFMKLMIVLFNTGRLRQNETNDGPFYILISQCCMFYWTVSFVTNVAVQMGVISQFPLF
jgi:hypothetical protein